MKKLLLALMLLALPLQAQEYTSRYFHYNSYFDAPPPFSISATTVDGTDNNAMLLAGGGAAGTTRGAYVGVYGNEYSTPGELLLGSGNAVGSDILLATGGIEHLSVPLSITAAAALTYGTSADSSPSLLIRSKKADAADDGTLQLTGGGAYGTTRGAGIQLLGDDYGGAAASGELTLMAGTGTAGNILLQTAGITHLTVPQSITAAAALVYGVSADNSPSLIIRSAKADAADDGTLQLTAGGAYGTTRGAGIQLLGDDYGGAAAGGGVAIETGTGTANGLSILQSGIAKLGLLATADTDDVTILLGVAATTAPVFTMQAQTADGDDDGVLNLTGGGGVGYTRGGTVSAQGNEASGGGDVVITAGNNSGDLFLRTSGTSSVVLIGAGAVPVDRSTYLELRSITEELTIAAGAGAAGVDTAANLCAAGNIVGVSVRVTQAPGGGAATFGMGCAGGGNLDQFISAVSTANGGTFTYPANGDGTATFGVAQKTAAKMTVTTNANVTGASFKVRIIVYYFNTSAPAS